MTVLRSVKDLVLFVLLPFKGVNELANWLTLPVFVAAVGVPAGLSGWVRSDWRWLALAGWVLMALLVIAVVRQYFAMHPLRGVLVNPLDAEQPEAWSVDELRWWFSNPLGPDGHAFRLTVVVENQGPGRLLEAVAQDMQGLNVPPHYGPFNLQWDVHPGTARFVPKGKTWKLHVAAGGDASIAFLGPNHVYKRLDDLTKGLRFSLELRVEGTDTIWSHPMEIVFERYAVRIGDQPLVRDRARPILRKANPPS